MERALDLLSRAEAAYVTTLDAHGRPRTRAMFNLCNTAQFPGLTGFLDGERFTTFFTTNTSSSKVTDLRANPVVSVYYCLPLEFHGLMLGGEMEIVTDSATRRAIWQPGWTTYYPGGPDDPDHTILRLAPSEARHYFQLESTRLV